jgi:RNA polymerase sigma factor (sigma-70 family)
MGKVRRAERALLDELGRPPTDDEVARALGLETDRVEELRRVGRDPVSLDSPVGAEGESVLGDLVTDTGSGSAVEAVEYQVMVGELRRLLGALPERHALVLRLRYGLDDGEQRNLTEIARELGLSRERVRQLERDALLRLRDPRASGHLLDWAS